MAADVGSRRPTDYWASKSPTSFASSLCARNRRSRGLSRCCPATPETPRPATNYRESGFVHRRDLAVGGRCGEGPESTLLSRSGLLRGTTGKGHEDRFLPLTPSARCGFQ
jgi:hypothetical protein